MPFHLRAFRPDGSQVMLPDWRELTVSSIFSDVGSMTFQYATRGLNADVLADQVEVAVFDYDGEVPDTRAIIESTSGAKFAVDGNPYRTFTGRTMWKRLEEAAVYNDGWPNNPGNRVYSNATIGSVLGGTLSKAGSLGEIPGFTWDFNDVFDSEGNPWPKTVTMELSLGMPLLQFVQNLVDQGLVEIRIEGRHIIATMPGELGRDLTQVDLRNRNRNDPLFGTDSATVTTTGPVILWAAHSAMEAPEESRSGGIRTVAIVQGEEGVIEEVVDATAVAKYARRPLFIKASGISDRGTLRAIGESTLAQQNDIRISRTYRYAARPGMPRPMREILPGDWIYTDMSGDDDGGPNIGESPLESMRIRQVTIQAEDADTEGTVTLTLNDIFLDRDILLSRKVAGITGGASGSGGLPGDPDAELDTLAPGKVLGLSLSSTPYSTREGVNQAQVTAVWSAMTQNSDLTPLNDFDHYSLQWRYSTDSTWSADYNTPTTTVSWSPVQTGRNVYARVRCVDRNGNAGQWSDESPVFTASDQTPPPKPSTPVLTPYLGGARAFWDGKGSAGEAMPADFSHIEIHTNSSAAFTPSASTLYMTSPVGGYTPLMDLSYTAPTYVRFVAVDLATPPNKSAPSNVASTMAERLVEADVAEAAITAGKLADAAATLAKIAPNAIDATKITNDAILTRHVAAGQITATEMLAGTITAASGIIGDAAITNAKIANLAVNNAKIADLTIQDAKIANLAVGKLTAGILQADITLGARVATSLFGARVELNASGLFAYDSSGTQTARISTTGDVAMIGTFRTGRTNGRQVVISSMMSNGGGGAANQAGIVFDSNLAVTRFSQVYDTGTALRLDSPATGTTAGTQGSTLKLDLDAIRGLIAGGVEAFRVSNSGEWYLGSSNVWISGQPSGTWKVGHFSDQQLYSVGYDLVIFNPVGRTRFLTDSWVDFWGEAGSGESSARVYVHGTFGATSKSFIIDHPLDADRKLVHGTTESPNHGVEYWGTATVPASGEAVVQLPHYFEALTEPTDRAVFLTPLGAPVPLGVSDIADGRFTVCGPAGTRFHWTVKAVRDRFEVEPLADLFTEDPHE